MIITDQAVQAWRRWFDGDPRAGIIAADRDQTCVTRHPDGTATVRTPRCKLITDRAHGGMLRVIDVKRLRSDKGNIAEQKRRRDERKAHGTKQTERSAGKPQALA